MGDIAEQTSQSSQDVTIRGYRLLREIGQGGMARVYEALNEKICKRVALKILSRECASHMAQRFLNEARTINQIHHSGLINIFEFGETEDGSFYIAMELLEGQSLSSLLKQGPLSRLCLLSIAQQLASTLLAVHAAGIVHRDLKPDNVILIRDPAVLGGLRTKLFDFGIAKIPHIGSAPAEPGSTQAGLFLGTPHFAAPEQIRDASQVTGQADVYALGILLFNMFTGRLPFDGDVLEVLASQATQPAPSLHSLVPDGPAELLSLVDAMLAKDPLARPALGQIEQVLGSALAALSLAGIPDTRHTVSRSPHGAVRSRRRLLAAALGLALLTGLIAARLLREDHSGLRQQPGGPVPPAQAPAAGPDMTPAASGVSPEPAPRLPLPGPAPAAPPEPAKRPLRPAAAPAPKSVRSVTPTPGSAGRGRRGAEPQPRPEPARRAPERSPSNMTDEDVELLR
jgi:serine/threonine-protein kinase